MKEVADLAIEALGRLDGADMTDAGQDNEL
jgi:hypothetical protein